MGVKDNRGVCDVCGKRTTEQNRIKIVFQKRSGEESFHQEAHRGRCAAVLGLMLAQDETGEVETTEADLRPYFCGC